jgi:hypothetical protein
MSAAIRLLARVGVTVAVTLAISAPLTALVTTPAGAAPPPTPAPRLLTIVTVPPIPGVSVLLDGRALTTGPDGTVRTLVTKEQRDALAADRSAHLVLSTPNVTLPDNSRARFHGWYDGGYHYSPTDLSGQTEVAAFDVDYLTAFSFVDARGARVDPRRVTRTELRDEFGTTIETPGAQPVWLVGRSVVSTLGRVTLRDIEYRFTQVMVNKVNVVRRGKLRFAPRVSPLVRVPLNLFAITFSAHDAIFGQPRGSAIDIQLEDGTTRHLPLQNGKVTVNGLPPGKYIVVTKAMGLGREQTFAFSHSQTAEIQIIDPLDLGLVLAVFALLAGMLLVAGRRMRRARRRRRTREARPAASAVLEERTPSPSPHPSETVHQ